MRKLLILTLLFISHALFAQDSQNYELKRSISDIFSPNGKVSKTLTFDGANIEESSNFLPYFSKNIKITNNQETYLVSLKNSVYETLSQEEIALVDPSQITSQIDFQLLKADIRKQTFLQVSFLPIRKNPSTGTIEKLKTFKIELIPQGIKQDQKRRSEATYTNQSVLSKGRWVKIKR